jgi:hypothetical protein
MASRQQAHRSKKSGICSAHGALATLRAGRCGIFDPLPRPQIEGFWAGCYNRSRSARFPGIWLSVAGNPTQFSVFRTGSMRVHPANFTSVAR